MIHNELSLEYLKNKKLSHEGMDSYKKCADKTHFKNYKKHISYVYNSRGFRDEEWDDTELNKSIWCIGDSFSLGVGQPFDETLHRLLNARIGINTINISMCGTSNEWISRKVNYITKYIKPETCVIQWTFTTRRESSDINLLDNERRMHRPNGRLLSPSENMGNFIKCLLSVEEGKGNTNIIHLFVPKWHSYDNEPLIPIVQILELIAKTHGIDNIITDWEIMDYARDYYHYDILTTTKRVDDIIQFLQ